MNWLSCTELRVRVRVRVCMVVRMHDVLGGGEGGGGEGGGGEGGGGEGGGGEGGGGAGGGGEGGGGEGGGLAAAGGAAARAEGARAEERAAEARVEEATVVCDGPVKQRGGCRVGVRVFVRVCVQQGEWLELRTRTWIWTSGYHPNCEALGAHEWHSFAGRVLPKGARQTE